jgi:hypothetical protein
MPAAAASALYGYWSATPLLLAKAAAKGTDWSAVAAWAAWAMVLIYLVIGLFAWRQVREARTLREEQARPFVIVDFEPGFLVYLTVKNLGRTMARDVRINFDKKLTSSLDRPRELDETPLFRESIPALPPGKKIRVLFDQFNARTEAKLPLTYDVDVRYRGPTGSKHWKDTYRLDLGMYLGSALPPKGMPELVAEAEAIRKEIKKWQGTGARGLLVHTIDQRWQDLTARRRMNAHILSQQGRKAVARSLWDRTLSRFGLR